ncbi:MAG: C4-dicarboxylate ABC transporter [Thermaerobacter sp.]|nr:C4-dicarboxylate ABC transporter [Thermaerobacter sp.]
MLSKHFGTNWFTTVMGVGIVAALTYASPVPVPGQHGLGIVLFALTNVVFVVATTLWLHRWAVHTREALDDFRHPTRALYWGALAMGLNVVGNDYLIVGSHVLPPHLAIAISQGFWIVGVAVSLFTVVTVPYLLFLAHRVTVTDTLASWLIPVVPPIVAAATGSSLLPTWGSAAVERSLTALIIAMFGITFFLFLMVSAMVYARLVYHQRLEGANVPSLWVEIGPIGMSMAIFSTLPLTAAHAAGPLLQPILAAGGVFAMAMWGLGAWWIVISSLHTLLHLGPRGDGIPFHLGWWSYVFPIGSFTTGTDALTHLTHWSLFTDAGFVQLLMLWGCFAVVFVRTVKGALDGSLLGGHQPLRRWRLTPQRAAENS